MAYTTLRQSVLGTCVRVFLPSLCKSPLHLWDVRESEERYVPCSPDEPGAWPSSLKQLEELGYATRVQAQPVTIDDFQNVLLHFRPTDYSADLE